MATLRFLASRQAVARPLYLRAGGSLDFAPPAEGSDAFDEFISDPFKPVPFTMQISTDYPRSYPLEDQRFAAERPDVLVYQTEPLEEDLTIAGPIKTSLHVSTTGTDADWVVKVVDVYAAIFLIRIRIQPMSEWVAISNLCVEMFSAANFAIVSKNLNRLCLASWPISSSPCRTYYTLSAVAIA
jgi:hypothetical protein